MSRPKVSPTPEFEEAVSEYQTRSGFKSWSQALLHLAAIGLKQEMGATPPHSKQWGGNRHLAKTEEELPCPECGSTNIVFDRNTDDGPWHECLECGWKED